MAFLAFKIFNIFPGIISCLLLSYYLLNNRGKSRIPCVLWNLWLFCYFPFIYVMGIASVALTVIELLDIDIHSPWYFYLFGVLGFAGQQIRVSLIITILERLVATIFLEKYANLSQSFLLSLILSIFTYLVTIGYSYVLLFGFSGYTFDMQLYFSSISIIAIHLVAIISCKLLQVKNARMYRSLAFRVSLKRRYQILQNVKILSFFWYSIVILSTVGPLGIIARWLYFFIFGHQAPYETIYLSYNLSFIIIFIWFFLISGLHKKKVHSEYSVSTPTVAGVLGKRLPTNITTETYFKNLRDQWN